MNLPHTWSSSGVTYIFPDTQTSWYSACVILKFTLICLFIYVLKSVWVNVQLLRSKDNFEECVLSFQHVDSKNRIQVAKHSGISFPAKPSCHPSDQLTNSNVTFYGLRGIIAFKGWGDILSPLWQFSTIPMSNRTNFIQSTAFDLLPSSKPGTYGSTHSQARGLLLCG